MLIRKPTRRITSLVNRRNVPNKHVRLLINCKKRRTYKWPNFTARSKLSNLQQNRHDIFVRIYVYAKLLDNMWVKAGWNDSTPLHFTRFN